MEGQEKAMERLENIPQLLKVISWKDSIEIASKLILSIVGICYIAGLLILNIHLRKYGVFHLNFLQIEYVMVGALWIFLCGSIYCFYYQVIVTNKPNFREWTTLKKKIQGIFLFLVSILVVLTTVDGIVWWLSDFDLIAYKWRTYLVVGVIASNVYVFNQLADVVRAVVKEWADTSSDKVFKRARTYALFFQVVLFLGSLSGYAYFAYPKLSPAFGGGMKQKAEFVIKADQLDSVKTMGIPVEDEGRRTGPIEVIFEASDFFIISPPAGFDTRNKVKSIRIRKDIIDAAYYLEYK